MQVRIDVNGDFETDANGLLVPCVSTLQAAQQNAEAEIRCVQNTYAPLPTYGRNPLVWTLSQSISDRIDDLNRIASKYITVQAISYQNGKYTVQ